MSDEPPQKPNPMDAFQSVWYRLVLLFYALYLAVFWFVVGPSNPWYAVGVVGGTFILGPKVAAPGMRLVPRQSFPIGIAAVIGEAQHRYRLDGLLVVPQVRRQRRYPDHPTNAWRSALQTS